LLKRIIFEAERSTDDKNIQTKAIRNACRVLSEIYDPHECSADIATKVHKIAYETLRDEDPYKDLKKKSNNIAKSLLPHVEELIRKSEDPLKTSIICSIVGNILDFGIEGGSSHPARLKDEFKKIYSDGLGYDDYPKLIQLLKKARNIIFFSDNCGEIVFDKILCREIKRFNPQIFITLVVRGKPIISDATLEDIKDLHFEEVADDILTTGCFAIGVNFDFLSPKLKKALLDADLIVCKGMANYESFSETTYKPIAYLLRSKCIPIATSMGIPLNVSAIKVYS
jgi:hypothetical protein